MGKKIIAVVGMCGSGKSVAVDFLEKKGYQKVYFGGVIYEKMKEKGIEITPSSQKKFRENLRKEYGMGVVAQILLPKIKEFFEKGSVVLDGLYSWEEYKILEKEFPEIKVLCIITDKDKRYERLRERKERPFTKEEAIERDLAEIENSNKAGPIAYADLYIVNNEDKKVYEKKLEKFIQKMEEEK